MKISRWAACLALAASLAGAADLRLLDAVKRRDSKAFEALLQQHADIDAAAPDGATALAWASFLDLREMAEKLIAAGAKVNTVGDYGETPLTLALANRDASLAEELLKARAEAKVARWNGETALMIAAGVGSVEEVKMLLDRGVDVNGAEPKSLQNALMWAASEGHAAVVDVLIQRGADVKATSKAGFTPLIFAALKNDPVSVQRLLAAGANPNDAIPDGTKVLTIATSKRGYAAAIALVDGGADPNVADSAKTTPLHTAAQAGALDLVKKLLAKGANVNVQTAPAKEKGFFVMPGEQTPLLLAARSDRVDVMRVLIEAGADTTLKAQDGSSLLLAASASGRVTAAKYAFEFDKNVKAVDNNGQTAMHKCVSNFASEATQEDRTELTQFLADIGVPLDQDDARGKTPIELGDPIPLDQPIQRMADIIVSRGGKPKVFPKEYKKPAAAPLP
ncbi:MAG: ankyrin repeat domain-containing protein [Bryobacteraceae bacterium]